MKNKEQFYHDFTMLENKWQIKQDKTSAVMASMLQLACHHKWF